MIPIYYLVRCIYTHNNEIYGYKIKNSYSKWLVQRRDNMICAIIVSRDFDF